MMAMTIGGYDPSGGAGILNDIKTFHALGVYGTAVITVLTAQNSRRVEDIEPVSTNFIQKQIETVLEDIPIKFAKTGMLYSSENVRVVSEKIVEHDLNLVVDPVMVAGCGSLLSVEGYTESVKKYLLPNAVLATPNINEAEMLSGIKIDCVDDAVAAAFEIGKICDVIVTGGHLNGENVFFNGTIKIINDELIESVNTHGTGCSYSAAITAGLAQDIDLLQSIKMAGEFVKESVINGEWGTLNQFHNPISK
ncbi:bifunctional hydroxymethylpyrimidine kinase/phosphomethylpyrimidine kinase [Methanobacterium sp.]|uniref:bifunctional hydroxymethylpyrimidine kinase/phosphomethylpyrimidine kinase n=1 Tax=Methanobacterium sp. TaxID=2164 RepID=UPI003C738D56